MGLFVSGPDPLHGAVKGGVHSLWMAGRSQLWRLDNLLSHGQTHEGATHLTMPQSPRWHQEKLWLLKMARVQAVDTRTICVPNLSLPGLQTLSPTHYRLDLVQPSEHPRAAGIGAMQRGELPQAVTEFAAAVRLDPPDATAYSFFGHCLMNGGRLALARLHGVLAQQYNQHATGLNPLPTAGLQFARLTKIVGFDVGRKCEPLIFRTGLF